MRDPQQAPPNPLPLRAGGMGPVPSSASRRQVLTGLAAVLAASPLWARGMLGAKRPGSMRSAAGTSSPSGYDALYTLAAGCSYDLIASRMPVLHTTALTGGAGGTSQALAALNAAVDILEDVVAAGAPSLGLDIVDSLLFDELVYQEVVLAIAPEATELQDLLRSLGLTNADLQAAFTHMPSLTVGMATNPRDGLAALDAAQLQQIRSAASGLIVSKPTQCLFAVEAAALSGAAVMSAIDGSAKIQSSLFSGFAGMAFTGIAADVLP